MECVNGRISYASWRLKVFRQLFLSSPDRVTPSRSSRRKISSTSYNWNETRRQDYHVSGEQGNIPNENGEGKEGNTAANPSERNSQRPSQLLPQSPLLNLPRGGLDKKRKKPATAEDIKDLRTNPWAIALASPPRMCSVTGARLPKALMGDWGMVQRPDSDRLWLIPVGLLRDELEAAEPQQASNEGKRDPAEKPKPSHPLRLLTLRMLDRLLLLKEVTKQIVKVSPSKKSPATRLIPHRWKEPRGPFTSRDENRITWREDMPAFVLRSMRKEAVKKLKRACDRYKHSNAVKVVWRDVPLNGDSEAALVEGLKQMPRFKRMECGSVLILRAQAKANDFSSPSNSCKSSHDQSSLSELEQEMHSMDSSTFPDLVMLPQCQSKVPVFDLSALLSETDLEELGKHHPRFRSRALFFRPVDAITVDAVLGLWRLKGSVMHDKDFLS